MHACRDESFAKTVVWRGTKIAYDRRKEPAPSRNSFHYASWLRQVQDLRGKEGTKNCGGGCNLHGSRPKPKWPRSGSACDTKHIDILQGGPLSCRCPSFLVLLRGPAWTGSGASRGCVRWMLSCRHTAWCSTAAAGLFERNQVFAREQSVLDTSSRSNCPDMSQYPLISSHQ